MKAVFPADGFTVEFGLSAEADIDDISTSITAGPFSFELEDP